MIDAYETRIGNVTKIRNRKDPQLPIIDYTGEFAEYKKNGYLVLKNFFDLNLISELLSASVILYSNSDAYRVHEPTSEEVRSILAIHERIEFKALLSDESFLNLIHSIFLDSGYIHQSRINFKVGKKSTGWSWHSDFETWHSQDGMIKPDCFSAMIPLVENTSENGCLKVISGSHKYYCSVKKTQSTDSAIDNFKNQTSGVPSGADIDKLLALTGRETVEVTCSPGDLVIFDSNLMHSSSENTTDIMRVNLYLVMNSIHNKLTSPFSSKQPRPEEMGHRLSIKEL